jgi:hypothetical protein
MREVAEAVTSWTTAGTTALSGSSGPDFDRLAWGDDAIAWERLRTRLTDDQDRRAFDQVLRACLTGAAHTFLVILDGGTSLSDNGRRVFLTDEDGQSVGEGLHEYLPDHLAET